MGLEETRNREKRTTFLVKSRKKYKVGEEEISELNRKQNEKGKIILL